MTKQELITLVNKVHHLWNQQPPLANNRELYEAWWTMLHDLPTADVHTAVEQLAALDKFMPRPGTIRRRTLEQSGLTLPPTGIEAWNVLRRLSTSVNNGTFSPDGVHPTVLETIRVTGHELSTNGDRDLFIRTFDQVAERWLLEMLAPVALGLQP